jgi:hypothetical protein
LENAAGGILLATETYNKPEPVDLDSGMEIKIKELVKSVVELTSFKEKIVWVNTKPDGQPRRCLDISGIVKHFV